MDFNDEGKAHRCFQLIDTKNYNVSLDIVQMHINTKIYKNIK